MNNNIYNEYLLINHAFELIGSTDVDFTQFVERSISGGIPSDYISWKSALNKNMLNIGERTFKWGDGTAATQGEFYVYGNRTELRGRSVNIGWSGDSDIKHGGIAQNTPLGFVIQDGNGIISGAADVTTLSGASLNNSLQLSGGTISGSISIINFNEPLLIGDDSANYFQIGERGQRLGIGWRPILQGYYGVMVVGYNAAARGSKGCVSIGEGIQNNQDSSLAIGKYNVNTDAYFVVGNGVDNDNRSNCFVINRNGDVDSSGALKCAGDKLEEAPSTLIITPMQGVVYKHTLEENDEEITFQTPTSGYSMTCELWLTQPSTALSGLTFTTTILWDDGSGKHASTNAMPDISDADTLYALVIRYDGEDWLGSLAYSKEIQGE